MDRHTDDETDKQAGQWQMCCVPVSHCVIGRGLQPAFYDDVLHHVDLNGLEQQQRRESGSGDSSFTSLL